MPDTPNTPHKYGELYPGQPENGQRRFVLTTLHKGCGAQVIAGHPYLWKAMFLKQDGTLGCTRCLKQPISPSETYEDYC